MNLKVKSKKQLAVIIISAVIITAIGITAVVSFSNAHKVDDKFWDIYKLSKNMPKPEFKVERDNVYEDEDEKSLEFSAEISDEQYSEYLEKCKKAGFTHNAYNEDSYFAKYNDKGDLISIDEFDPDSDVSFRFYEREKLKTINWPKHNECANLLPVPKSNYGKIQEEDSESLLVLIGKTSYSDYKKYVGKVLKNNKINKDYERDDYYYISYDSNNKYEIEIDYLGNKMMLISVQAAEDEESSTSEDETQKNESPKDVETSNTENSSSTNNNSTSTTTETNTSSIRPEVKKAIDDYETFMKSYVAFMQKYQNSDDVTSMLKDYNDMMTKYSDMTSQFNSLQSKYQLNEAELNYYLEAQNRISDMMMEI